MWQPQWATKSVFSRSAYDDTVMWPKCVQHLKDAIFMQNVAVSMTPDYENTQHLGCTVYIDKILDYGSGLILPQEQYLWSTMHWNGFRWRQMWRQAGCTRCCQTRSVGQGYQCRSNWQSLPHLHYPKPVETYLLSMCFKGVLNISLLFFFFLQKC